MQIINSHSKFHFTHEQKNKALKWLVFWHIFIIITSNYLVQIPFTIFGLHTTWGAFTFPFIFLTTDLTVRIFGALLARKIIFWAMIPALIATYIIGVLFYNAKFMGFESLSSINTVVARIALASFLGYLVGQCLDIGVFNHLRQLKNWWIAPAASTILGNAIDTVIFFSVAFAHGADEFMAAHWIEFAMVDYGWKIAICGLFFLPAYGVLLKFLLKKLTTVDTYQSEPTIQNA